MDKQALRERVWDELEAEGVARFPFPPHDRIPNFEGASAAADRLADTPAWEAATVLKTNPDAPQLPVRRAALAAGKTVFVAVPRLRDRDCFYRLDPGDIDDIEAATTVSGIGEYGEQVGPDEVGTVDLVVSGSVAVAETGARIGKGEGFSDLEYAVLSRVGAVTAATVTATTVHERQVRSESWDSDETDVPMEVVVTPERRIDTGATASPTTIDWAQLDDEDVEAMPVLESFTD